MTVAELMDLLRDLPPETRVLVEGYETGYDDIVELRPLEVFRYRNAQEWDGEYQAKNEHSGQESHTVSAVAIVGRRGRLRKS